MDDFVPGVIAPILKMASISIDAYAILGGMLLPGTINEKVSNAYRKYLLGDATLQDLPDDFPRICKQCN